MTNSNNTLYQRVRLFYKQFPFVLATKLVISESVRKILDPCRLGTYSQTGEDRIIYSIINSLMLGSEFNYYVDIGCNHPFSKSNTLSLYMRGWSGLCIDANPELIKKFSKTRIRDTSICAVISNCEEQKNLTISYNHAFTTISENFREKNIESKDIKEQMLVNTTTLETIFAKYNIPEKFGLLSIDVEGYDFEALTSFDLNKHTPILIVIEMHDFDFLRPSENRVYSYLRRNGYRLHSYSVMNGYFLLDEYYMPKQLESL